MKELPAKYKKLVEMYEPIEIAGFTLYPFTVEFYEEYLIASAGIGYMQQSLPIDLMSVPLLSAFFKMDRERVVAGKNATGLLTSVVIALVLALRLAKDQDDVRTQCEQFQQVVSVDDPTNLKALMFTDAQGETRTITPSQFAKMRPIIAAQNGIEIRDELDNPELVQAEKDLAEKGAVKLDAKKTDMVDAAVVLSGVSEKEIYQWPVLRLTRLLKMHKRIIDYQVCAIAEGSGAKWKGGNPTPHPFFQRIKDSSDALVDLNKFANGAGMQAMKDAGAI